MQKAGTFFGLIQPWRLAYSQATRKDALHWWPPRGTVLKTTFTVVNKYSWSHSLKGQKILQKHGYVVHAYIHRVLRVSYLWLAALWGWQICEIWLHLEEANEHTPGRESVHLTEKKKSFGFCTINPEKFDCDHDWVYLWFSFCSSEFFDPSWCLWTVPKASENRSETPSLPLQDFIILSLSLLSLSPEEV